MKSLSFSIRMACATIGLSLGLASGAAVAEGPAGLAPPGPCAEPREAVSGVSVSNFSVVGPLQRLFSPADVAAAPQVSARPAPSQTATARPVACDQPGANCAPIPASRRSTPPIVPGGRPGNVVPSMGKPMHPAGPPGLVPGHRPKSHGAPHASKPSASPAAHPKS